jgi:peptidoglycan hydrolase-like protein with peptidoglycan-binding domain
MQSIHRVHRARTAAATLVVTGLAVLVVGCAAAVAREPSSAGAPTPSASAGLLARGAGYDQVAGSQRVRALQSRLRRLSHDPGPIDGLFGPRTEAAVRGFQQSRGLAADGIVGRATAAALGHASASGPAQPGGGHRTTGTSCCAR